MIKLGVGTEVRTEEAPSVGEYIHDPASDARVVEDVRRGDRDAFGILVARYEKRLHRLLRRLVHDQEQARDLAQETFLKVYQHLDQFDASRRFGPWLFRVAVNLAVDWLRKRKPIVRLNQMVRGDEHPMEIVDPDPRPRLDLEQEIHRVIQEVPMAYRTVLVLRDLEGFSCSEVAAIEGRREATIRWRLSRARDLFRKAWGLREESRR
jgi:RNA polymerase sigma-70 factor (ECF subfamily)